MTGGIQKQCSAHYQVKFSWDSSLGCNLSCWPISELTTPAASVGMSLSCPSGCRRCSKSCLSLSGTFQCIRLLPWQARLCLSGSGFVLHGEQESWGWLFSTCASHTHAAACTHFSFFLRTQNTNNTGDSGKGALALWWPQLWRSQCSVC